VLVGILSLIPVFEGGTKEKNANFKNAFGPGPEIDSGLGIERRWDSSAPARL
jgi:hypothetical protein